MKANRRLLVVGILLSVWAAAGFLIVPRLIVDAYAGRSLEALNGMIGGRDKHAVTYYLTAWNRVFLLGSLAFVVAAAVMAVIPWRRVFQTWKRFAAESVQKRVSALDAVVAAVAFGLITGVVEAVAHIVFTAINDRPRWGNAGQYYTQDLLWMTPLANALAFLVLASVIAVVLWRLLRDVPIRPWIGGVVALSVYAIISSLFTSLHELAVLCIAIGVGIQVALWAETRLPLVIRSSRRIIAAGLILCLLIPAGGAVLGNKAHGKRDPNKRNVLFIVLDTQRAANLSLYGYARKTTPNIDRFASRAVVFDRAISTAPWTLASHASMFTGHWPSELSVDWNVRLDEKFPTIAEIFRDRGYATAAFVANEIYTSPRSGLERGFQDYEGDPQSLTILLKNAWLTRVVLEKAVGGQDSGLGRKRADDIRREFLSWVDDTDAAPFFVFLNLMDGHSPYLSETPFDTMYSGHYIGTRPHMAERSRYTASQVREFVDAYDQSLTAADEQIGRIFAELEERDILDKTVVIITADHGEQLGEKRRDLILHGNSLYYSLLHVPLIIRVPGDDATGHRIGHEVSLRDLAATTLDVAGIEDDDLVPGTSLAVTWEQEDFDALSESLSELSPKYNRPGARSAYSLVFGRYHYIINGKGQEELYDLEADPWERTDLSTALANTVLPDIRARMPNAADD